MTLKVAVVGLAVLAISYGAVVPQAGEADFLFDTIQSFLAQPDSYAQAAGFSRSKRSSGWDKEFKLDTIGGVVRIKYDDPNNQLKGGKAEVVIDNLKKYVKQARSSYVKLEIDFDGGASHRDGLFSLEIKYELHHQGVEKGVFTATRSKTGNMWSSHLVNKNTQGPSGALIFPDFELKGKSDRRTKLTGTYSSDRFHSNYNFNVDRVPGEKLDAVIEGHGRKYTLNSKLDKAAKKLTAVINANGLQYNMEADFDDDGREYKLDLKVNMGNAGVYGVVMSLDYKNFQTGSFDVKFNDNDFAKLKLKGKLNKMEGSAKYELRYTTIAFGDGKLRFSRTRTANGGITKAQYLPKNGLDLKIEGERSITDDLINLKAKATRGDEEYLKYNLDIEPSDAGAGHEVNVKSEFNMNEKSILYPVFCSYGCFKKRALNARMYSDKDKPYKIDVDVHLFKDADEVLTVDINTMQSPYVFKLVAPRILPKILYTGRESIEFEADHKPGQYLHVTSNTNMLSSFNVDKMSNGMRKIELNGKELVQADFNVGDNTVSQTTTLPDGRSLTTTVSWQSDDLKKNRVNVKLDGTERNMDSHFEWDVNNREAMTCKMQAKGNNKRWGNWEISRDVKMAVANRVFKVDLTGDAKFDNFAMPSPIATKMQVNFDFGNKDYLFDLQKDFDGKKMGVTLNNGKFSITV